jgi:hypothetical protein
MGIVSRWTRHHLSVTNSDSKVDEGCREALETTAREAPGQEQRSTETTEIRRTEQCQHPASGFASASRCSRRFCQRPSDGSEPGELKRRGLGAVTVLGRSWTMVSDPAGTDTIIFAHVGLINEPVGAPLPLHLGLGQPR